MARPSKDSMITDVKERIRDALWTLFQKKTIGQISVKEIITLAGCNRTTFYYHYSDVYAVLEEIELLCLPVEIPNIIVQIITTRCNHGEIVNFISSHHDLYEQICYLLSAKGDPMFAQKFKNEMLCRWYSAAGIEFASLDKTIRLRIELIIGGLMSLFACYGNGDDIKLEEIAEAVQSFITKEMLHLMTTTQ